MRDTYLCALIHTTKPVTTLLRQGPHLPNTGKIKAFSVLRTSGTNWLGKPENDQLQRVYGVSFPDKKMLKIVRGFGNHGDGGALRMGTRAPVTRM